MAQDDLTLTVESSTGGLEPGDEVTGTITSNSIRTVQTSDGDVDYFDVTIEEDETGIELTPSWPAKLTESTGLGNVVQQMGVDLVEGREITVSDVFKPGTKVAFTIGSDDAPDDDDRDYYLRCDDTTLRPAGDDEPEQTGDDDTGQPDDQLQTDVLDIVSDFEGESESAVRKEIVGQSPDHYKAFKEMKGESVEVVDGDVFLA